MITKVITIYFIINTNTSYNTNNNTNNKNKLFKALYIKKNQNKLNIIFLSIIYNL